MNLFRGRMLIRKKVENILRPQMETIGLGIKAVYLWELDDTKILADELNKLKIAKVSCEERDAVELSSACIFDLSSSQDENTNSLIFYGKIHSVIDNINFFLFEQESRFIDVSSTLNEPSIIVDSEELREKRSGLENFKRYLKENCRESFLRYESSIDLTCLAGVILGYPVVYCNSTPSVGNCLSYQTLRHYRVTAQACHMKNFELYSFTVPQKFWEVFEEPIKKWLDLLRAKENRCQLKMSIELENHALILT